VISSIKLCSFKSFSEQKIPLAPFTLLIGANASGKSNLFDAIRFLQGLSLDYGVSDVMGGRWEGGREIWQGIRGGAAEIVRFPNTSSSIETVWTLGDDRLTHAVEFNAGQHPHIVRESLAADRYGQYLFDTHAATLGATTGLSEGGAINVGLKGVGGGRNPRVSLSSARSLLGQIRSVERLHSAVLDFSAALASHIAGITFLDITPSRMRGYSSKNMQELGAEGENVSAVLYRLCEASDEARQNLVDWLIDLCAPELKDVSFVETSLGDVLLQFIEADGTAISARSLSDGTLRFLGEVVALLTAPKGSILLVEEIENGLHPARSHLLVELYESLTKERGIQVIATTHSSKLLEALSPQVLKDAVVFARNQSTDGTITSRLGDLPNFDRVLEERGIDYLFTTKWLERSI
jgi:predicted ATPase